MGTTQLFLWPEGEKIPDDQIRRVFRKPPNVPTPISRSALVVGSKGAGKTTLLRYHKEVHQGIAIHLSLATELASLPKQAAVGPLSLHMETTQHERLIGKTISLLAASITHRLAKKGIEPPWDDFFECLPAQFAARTPRKSESWLRKKKAELSRAPLKDFGDLPKTKPLVGLLEELGAAVYRKQGTLLLLLDRADLVAPAALVPVLEALDQSPGFIALVATRPGHGGSTLARLSSTFGPGDHYDVFHLGLRPRSSEWLGFMEVALEAQLKKEELLKLPEDVRKGVLALSRDSIRTALEAFSRILSESEGDYREKAKDALEDLKELQLDAVQSKVRSYHPEFRRLVNDIRSRELSEHGQIDRPVELAVEPEAQQPLFQMPSELSLFFEAGLRSAGFCMPEGRKWLPGLLPESVEVPPLLLWDRTDAFWLPEKTHSGPPLQLKRRELLRGSGGPAPAPCIFVAFRMNNVKGEEFRNNLERALSEHPSLSRCEVVDGRVVIGTDWAPEIRERIKRARLVVGDATGLRSEVVFEMGFAHGLNRPILPVVSHLALEQIPYWLRGKQIGSYDSREDLKQIIAGIETHLADPRSVDRPKQRPAIPTLGIFFRQRPWNETAKKQFEAMLRQEGISPEIYDDDDQPEEVLQRATTASILVVSLDGTGGDAFAHFICGAIVAKPEIGYGGKKFRRKIIVLEPEVDSDEGVGFIAQSLSRCAETVRVCTADKVAGEIRTFTQDYKRWANRGSR